MAATVPAFFLITDSPETRTAYSQPHAGGSSFPLSDSELDDKLAQRYQMAAFGVLAPTKAERAHAHEVTA